MIDSKKVNMELKVARVCKNWTQEQLAKKAGISRRTLRLIENGESSPTIKIAAQICKALGVYDLDEIFKTDWDAVELPCEDGEEG